MSERNNGFAEARRTPMFYPLDRKELSKHRPPWAIPPYELVNISIEGPNGSGKSTVHK